MLSHVTVLQLRVAEEDIYSSQIPVVRGTEEFRKAKYHTSRDGFDSQTTKPKHVVKKKRKTIIIPCLMGVALLNVK